MRTRICVSVALLFVVGACDFSNTGSAGPLDAGTDTGSDAEAVEDAGPDAMVAPSTIEESYRILHWNIAGGKENGCQAPAITSAVVDYVRDRNIDFVGLNEVCRAQHDAIEAALRQHWNKGPGAKFSAYVSAGDGRRVGNSMFSRFDLQDVTREKLGSDQYGDRNLLCAATQQYPHLRFCSTHLSPADSKARIQLDRALSTIEGWWESRGDTVLWSGDLNIRPDDIGLNAVYSAAANHPQNNPSNAGHYREVDDADPEHCPGYGERSVPSVGGGPCGEGGKIDFIFVRENRIVDGQYSGDTLNIPKTCSGVCSDHRAVVGQVKVRIKVD